IDTSLGSALRSFRMQSHVRATVPALDEPSSDVPLQAFSELSLKAEELAWLRRMCSYLTPEYLDYLSAFRFKPAQVHMSFTPVSADCQYGNIEIEATGLWVETIFWEVPLMACLSEIFFSTTETDWSYDRQSGKLIPTFLTSCLKKPLPEELCYGKAEAL